MTRNFFEELHNKKQEILSLANKAVEYNWIKEEDRKNIINKLECDTLTIGVIGQMKCGKSTFLNSFVFESNVLPAATTPMTAALSVITYGKEKKIIAEFYNENEWQEQKLQASRSLSDVEGNTIEESKIKAAKDLVKRADKLGNQLPSLLGKTQEDTLDNLIDYVGAEGKYVSITKCVTIHYPKDYLKGVEIVDTPGFNDPIVSREERTKDFLKKADVVLMMLYAGRPFDTTDREILFQNVRQCGVGKVIIGINKYDIPAANGETEDEIKNYVKEEIKKACRECDDDSLVNILKYTEPIPLSAEMALLSQLPMNEIASNESFEASWKRGCNNFDISSQPQFFEKSHMKELAHTISNMVEIEKGKILFTKPLNYILAAGNNKKASIDKELRECEMLIADLNKPDYELEEKEDNINRAERRLTKKINGLASDLEEEFNNTCRNGKNELEDLVDDACRRMRGHIDAKGRFTSDARVYEQIRAEITNLVTRTLKRATENISNEAKRKIKNCISLCLDDIIDVLIKYFEDFNSKEFVNSIQKQITLDIENSELFTMDNSDDEEGVLDTIVKIFDDTTGHVFSRIGEIILHDSTKTQMYEMVTSISSNFDPLPYLENIYNRKDEIISKLHNDIIKEFITPIKEQLQEIRSKKHEKEILLKNAQENVSKLRTDKNIIEEQLSTINCTNI